MNIQDLNWDDVRFFVVAVRSESYREAAIRLGTTHPTVRRRLDALEEATGVRLFQRDVPGLLPTTEGRQLLGAAEEVERAIEGFARQARAADAEARGPVRVTLGISMALGLAPAIAAFAQAWPEIVLTLDTDLAFADLSAMQADVAIRAMHGGRLPDPSLAGRHATSVRQAVYGVPGVSGWIASSPNPDWVQQTPFPDQPVRAVAPDVGVRLQLCRLGLGLAVLPCFVADPHLPRRTEPEHGYDVWVLVHPDMRHNLRLKLFRDAMVEALRAQAGALQGA
jgi:DNA-binding transcriptional LysR family regulator